MKNKVMCIIILLFVSCARDTSIDLGDGYRFDHDVLRYRDNTIYGPYHNTIAVSPHVLAFAFDSTFIIALQKPRDIILADEYLNPNLTLDETEKIFKESQLRHFWIINKKAKDKYGPLSEEEFKIRGKVLNVPEELILEMK
jgi:hypothetical protein